MIVHTTEGKVTITKERGSQYVATGAGRTGHGSTPEEALAHWKAAPKPKAEPYPHDPDLGWY